MLRGFAGSSGVEGGRRGGRSSSRVGRTGPPRVSGGTWAHTRCRPRRSGPPGWRRCPSRRRRARGLSWRRRRWRSSDRRRSSRPVHRRRPRTAPPSGSRRLPRAWRRGRCRRRRPPRRVGTASWRDPRRPRSATGSALDDTSSTLVSSAPLSSVLPAGTSAVVSGPASSSLLEQAATSSARHARAVIVRLVWIASWRSIAHRRPRLLCIRMGIERETPGPRFGWVFGAR